VSGLVLLGLLAWFVDPGRRGECAWFGVLVDEPFGVAGVGGGEHVGSDGLNAIGSSIVDVDGMVPGNAGVIMLGVIPPEETLAERSGSFDRTEAVGEVRPVLQGAEMRLAVGVVPRRQLLPIPPVSTGLCA